MKRKEIQMKRKEIQIIKVKVSLPLNGKGEEAIDHLCSNG
jgi:hypothetical protein